MGDMTDGSDVDLHMCISIFRSDPKAGASQRDEDCNTHSRLSRNDFWAQSRELRHVDRSLLDGNTAVDRRSRRSGIVC